jgi:hypothetical protein
MIILIAVFQIFLILLPQPLGAASLWGAEFEFTNEDLVEAKNAFDEDYHALDEAYSAYEQSKNVSPLDENTLQALYEKYDLEALYEKYEKAFEAQRKNREGVSKLYHLHMVSFAKKLRKIGLLSKIQLLEDTASSKRSLTFTLPERSEEIKVQNEYDGNSIEVTMTPLSLDEYEANSGWIKELIFNTGKKMKPLSLTPRPDLNGL